MDILHTERLLLRRFTPHDARAYRPLVSDPRVLRHTGEAPIEDVESVRRLLLERPIRDYAVHGFGRLACIEKDSGHLIGFCGLKRLEDLGEIDIGYRFIPACWGKGYATEAATAVIRQHVDRFGPRRIVALVDPANAGSVRVLEKLGMAYERDVQPADAAAPLALYAGEFG
ncbi:GNAT family N-acetyltransferase [Coralloluteibacterium thermophilus]|uniref:GNAT family N-acetyltransferase n=1 Tax=Coralloluteibacterium thermophilum TaxID=2707049 RepID=A0ABV9NNK5_9GAMM